MIKYAKEKTNKTKLCIQVCGFLIIMCLLLMIFSNNFCFNKLSSSNEAVNLLAETFSVPTSGQGGPKTKSISIYTNASSGDVKITLSYIPTPGSNSASSTSDHSKGGTICHYANDSGYYLAVGISSLKSGYAFKGWYNSSTESGCTSIWSNKNTYYLRGTEIEALKSGNIFCLFEINSTQNTSGGFIDDTANAVLRVFTTIINYIFVFAGLAAVVYAVYLAIVFFRADTAEKREEAKKRLIYAVIGVVVCITVILVINFAISNINVWTGESLTN